MDVNTKSEINLNLPVNKQTLQVKNLVEANKQKENQLNKGIKEISNLAKNVEIKQEEISAVSNSFGTQKTMLAPEFGQQLGLNQKGETASGLNEKTGKLSWGITAIKAYEEQRKIYPQTTHYNISFRK